MTNPGHSGDQRGEHGGAMDKLKSVWRETVGSRDDEETRADGPADGREGRPEPSGTANPADVRPEVSARNASGMQPADADADAGAGPVAQQHPQHEMPQQAGPGSIPRQQHASPAAARVPQEQTVAAGAQAWGATQAPPAPAPDDRAYGDRAQQQASAPSRPAQPVIPHQTGAAPAPPQSAPRPGTGGTDSDDRRAGGEPGNQPDSSSAAAGPATTDDADTASTDESRGRHELFDADGKPSGGGTATAGAATAAGVAGAASGTRSDTDTAEDTATDGRADATARPESDGAAPETTSAAGSAGAQDVPANPDRFVPAERAEGFATRWAELKGDFVDEPRDAVRKADALVGDVLDEIGKVFTEQRSRLEHDLDTDSTSTEDLRQAMHRYRKFFERLLNI